MPASQGSAAQVTVFKGPVPTEGHVWVVAVPPVGSGLRVADVLSVPSTLVLDSGACHIPVAGCETAVACQYIEVGSREEFAAKQLAGFRVMSAAPDLKLPSVSADMRVLSICTRPVTGERFRSFEAAVPLMCEEAFDDWPIEGPRTTKWLCTEMVKSSPTPVARHHRWLRDADIPGTDRSRYEHQILSDILDKAVSYDCLQISNLASFEVLSRRIQHIEMAHIENPQAPDYSAGEFYMGSSERRGGALVAPGLALHVASRLRDDASIAKEQRKAREARSSYPSAPPPQGPGAPPPKGKGKGKKDKGKAPTAPAGPGAPAGV